MYILKKIALRKTRVHSDDTSAEDPTGEQPWIDVKAYIPKGTVYYQISNGTIGRGARYVNYSEKAMLALINSEAQAWVNGQGFKTAKELGLGNIESNVIPLHKKEYNIEADLDFTADDIPF